MAETLWLSTPPKMHALTAGAAVSIDPTISVNFLLSPNEDEAINATSPGYPGQNLVLIVQTINGTTRTLTFGVTMKTTATLVTGATTARFFVLAFVSTGTVWIEQSRTAAQV